MPIRAKWIAFALLLSLYSSISQALSADEGISLDLGIGMEQTDDPDSSQPVSTGGNIYLGLGIGIGQADDLDSSDQITADLGFGWNSSLALGYRWRNFRVEGEWYSATFLLDDFDNNTGRDVSEPDPPDCTLCSIQDVEGGSQDLSTRMINVYRDFELSDQRQFYVGVGFGRAEVKADYEVVFFNPFTFTVNSSNAFSAKDTVAARQVMFGWTFGKPIGLQHWIGFRFIETDDVIFRKDGNRLEQDGVSSQALEVGMRLNF